MDTKVIKIKADNGIFTPEEEQSLQLAGEILKAGGLVAFPTETVYGLGGDGLNKKSSCKIYEAKGRPSDNPLIIHICRFEDIYEIVEEVTETAKRIAEAFWPGPLTLILRAAAKVPRETTGGLDTVAVRFPSHPVAQKLIAYGGGFVAAPSANISGRPSPTVAQYVIEDMDGRIDMIVDGGEVGIGLESTIIDLTVEPPQILRPGYITKEMLEAVLGQVETDRALLAPDSGIAPKAPGMKYRHYAPGGQLVIVEGDAEAVAEYMNRQIAADAEAGEKTGVICTAENVDKYHCHVVKNVGSKFDEEAIARNLFLVLREFDDEKVTRIYSESFSDQGLGQAIMNRLLKAAGYSVVKV